MKSLKCFVWFFFWSLKLKFWKDQHQKSWKILTAISGRFFSGYSSEFLKRFHLKSLNCIFLTIEIETLEGSITKILNDPEKSWLRFQVVFVGIVRIFETISFEKFKLFFFFVIGIETLEGSITKILKNPEKCWQFDLKSSLENGKWKMERIAEKDPENINTERICNNFWKNPENPLMKILFQIRSWKILPSQ